MLYYSGNEHENELVNTVVLNVLELKAAAGQSDEWSHGYLRVNLHVDIVHTPGISDIDVVLLLHLWHSDHVPFDGERHVMYVR